MSTEVGEWILIITCNVEPCDYAVINLGTVSNFLFFPPPPFFVFLQALNKQTSMCNVFDKKKRKKKEKSIILSKSLGKALLCKLGIVFIANTIPMKSFQRRGGRPTGRAVGSPLEKKIFSAVFELDVCPPSETFRPPPLPFL